MKKFLSVILLSLTLLFILAPIALAEEATEEAVTDAMLSYHGKAVIAAAMAVTIAAFGCGLAQGFATGKAVEGIARNPGAAGNITMPLIIGLAMIESLTIYGFVVALVILFVKW
jgi:F-type H+-transporting ATPase subunit c